MSFRQYIRCDGCSIRLDTETTPVRTRAALAERGWTVDRSGSGSPRDYCKACTSRRKKNEPTLIEEYREANKRT